ncbi:hypothetical protein JD276_15220 [Leucobacter sp. CSA1]|uniref:Uncharacterized protein n=1 Tax=Leucobacter chromiisoli TaxID=2796471 RepID=A0A934UWL0_9MICO|nr:hypothetical protein [Leucobacter chromiisoli]MBK0420378.1 hypothetical protein [Leucobacter chromiisoli]
MNPWSLFIDLLGWTVVGVLAIVILIILIACIAGPIQNARRKRKRSGTTSILNSREPR